MTEGLTMKLYTYLNNPTENIVIKDYSKTVFQKLETEDFNSGKLLIKECEQATDSDLLIIDMILSFDDSIEIIKKIREMGCRIRIIILTTVDSEILTGKAIQAGADYIALKPYSLKELFATAEVLMKKECKLEKHYDSQVFVKRSMVEKEAAQILTRCGILPNVKGYRYLKFAAKEGFFNFDLIDGITKSLYPLIAKSFDTSDEKAERAIRHAIEVAWDKEKFNIGFEMLGFSKDVYSKRPTNSEFVYALVEYVKNRVV